jgi:thioredoxin-dependent peroxiredoxin
VLKEGDKAPSFDLESDSGRKLALSDFAGKTLVLYFYPRDSTPGCTREAQAFTEARAAIAKAGGAIVGVSRDSIKSHCAFRDKYAIGFPLLSDPDLTLHKAYGAWGEKNMYGKKVEGTLRSTFLVRDGRVVRVFPSVKVDGHAEQVLEALRSAGATAPKKSAARKTAAKKATTRARGATSNTSKKKGAKAKA